MVRRNDIIEHAKFNRRRQEEGETVDIFISSLYALAEHCDYGTLKDQMIRDPIVVGLQDLKLSEKLQLDHELTLTKAINQARQSEAGKKQQTLLRSDFKESTETKKELDAVKTRRTSKFEKESSPFASKKPFKNPSTHPPSSRCYRYGKSPGHTQKNCPAKDVTCHKCSKRGHWGAVCKSSKTVG